MGHVALKTGASLQTSKCAYLEAAVDLGASADVDVNQERGLRKLVAKCKGDADDGAICNLDAQPNFKRADQGDHFADSYIMADVDAAEDFGIGHDANTTRSAKQMY